MTASPLAETSIPSRRQRWRWLGGVAAVVVASVVVVLGWSLQREAPLPDGVSEADYAQAEHRWQRLYGRTPSRVDVVSLLGELAAQNDRLAVAAACFREVPSSHPRYGRAARLQAAQVLARLKRVREAEDQLREFLALADRPPAASPDHIVTARKWLGYILSVELRFEERKALLADVHVQGQADVNDSKQYYFPHLLIWHSPNGRQPLTEYLREDPTNPHLRLALGRYRTFEGRLDEARSLLEDLHRERPYDLRCTAALLECHFERSDWNKFTEVAQTLPPYDSAEPWLLTQMRAQFALHEEHWDAAVREFERVLTVDPANPTCHMGLARAYEALNHPEARDEIRRRSLVLSRIRADLGNINESSPGASRTLATACHEIGLVEAAETFRKHAARIERTNSLPLSRDPKGSALPAQRSPAGRG